LDGCGKAEQYVLRARELNHQYLACTDHGNIDGLIKFQKACLKQSITPILGIELYIVPDHLKRTRGEKRYHLVALITNEIGLENILKMLSIANLEGFYHRPRISPKVLLEHREGLIFLSACVSSFINMPGGVDLLLELNHTNTVCLEIMPHNMEIQKSVNAKKVELSRENDIPLVATVDCHYPLPHQNKTQEVLLAIQHKKRWTDEDRFTIRDWQLHMWSEQEVIDGFKRQGIVDEVEYMQAIENTIAVAELCNGYKIKRHSVELPKVCGFEDKDETELLRAIIEEGLIERDTSAAPPSVYRKRIEDEFEQICLMGFQRYFLIVWELVNWCYEQGIMTGPGRGSVGGSLVAYLMRITDVDPIRYGLIFARFVSPERIDFPDIDIDFEDERRHEVRDHLEKLYGEYNVAGISTFMTMKGRGALRDVSRVFGINQIDVDKAAKSIALKPDNGVRPGHTIEDSLKKSEELRSFQAKYPEIFQLATELEDQVRGVGQHAAAICISSEDLRFGKRCNLCLRDNKLVANWDKDDAEFMGMMKLDVLGLSSLTMLNYARKLIKKNHNVEIEFDKIPLNDEKVFHEMSLGHSVGVFQMGTPLLIRLSKEMGVNEFDDIVLLNALSRPGPLASGMTDEFIMRKRGDKPVVYLHPKMESFTKETLGIIVYQEQVMRAMYELAGLSWGICDKVRKVVSKSKGSEEFGKYKQQFIDGCIQQNTLTLHEASQIWDALSSHGSYSFNKSHSVEYSLIAYWTAWLKFNYPKEFMASLLTYGGDDNKSSYIDEARRLGLRIELPKFGLSLADKWFVSKHEDVLYAPFTEIKGIGKAQAQKIASKSGLNKGFFNINSIQQQSDSLNQMLLKIGADGRKLTDEEAHDIQKYFSFNISDKKNRFNHLYELENRDWESFSEDDLLQCKITDVNLIKIVKYYKPIKCKSCQLHEICRAPVNPSIGRYNIMICGEAPGPDEDEKGIGFIGKAGYQILWPELRKYGLSASMFHITNVVKCFPGKGKTPTKGQIEACRMILEDEITNLSPIVILAFGNTSVKFFTERNSGISTLSGTTIWSDRYKCWICWCIHPAAVLHSYNNYSSFEIGIKNFVDVLGRIGGKNWPIGRSEFTCVYDVEPDNNNFDECIDCAKWMDCAIHASKEDWRWLRN